ncbi:MAG TPA: gluconeogenesis factor YvcK family protein [Candidatus Sulfomarinibacteraceae bacterium]|nr:gluconeogenesis factor YvcK family protein [Candidatus Sulfomarinibacteraceae bacterium]
MNLRRWLSPGIGVKRWLGVVFIGLLVLALAVAHVVRQVSQDIRPGGAAQLLIDAVTLQFLPYALRGLIVGSIGVAIVLIGVARVVRAVTEPLRQADEGQPLVEVIYQKRFLAKGPKVVALGGGTGLSALLRGMKEHTSNITAIVTVADDGGSSGALREELGIPPVGDIRNCIAALADAEPLMSELLGYRFPGGRHLEGRPVETEPGGLGGHAIGNLLIAALTAVEGGDFEEGVRRMNRVLAVRGQVLPASPTPITLHAQTRNGIVVSGQSAVMRTSGIERVWITPTDVAASEDALAAIAEADLIVLGPGSLYTSLLPVLLIPRIREAVAAAGATRLYVCNVATQLGETAGYDLADHVEALLAHTTPGLIDLVLANDRFDAHVPADWRAESVRLRWPPSVEPTPRLATDDVVDAGNAHRHDPARLAAAVLRAVEREAPVRRRAGVARTA